MMGRGFQEAVRALPHFNFAAIAVIIFVAQGLAAPPPPPDAPFAAPTSPCAAPPCHYAVAVYLSFFAVFAVLCSFLLTSVVKLRLVEAASLPQKAGARTKATTRLLFALALIFSAASTGCGLAACSYTLEIQCGRLACMPAADRAGLYAAHVMGGAVWAWVYGNIAKGAFFSE